MGADPLRGTLPTAIMRSGGGPTGCLPTKGLPSGRRPIDRGRSSNGVSRSAWSSSVEPFGSLAVSAVLLRGSGPTGGSPYWAPGHCEAFFFRTPATARCGRGDYCYCETSVWEARWGFSQWGI